VQGPSEPPSVASALARVGVYRREVAASLERIWENVLDWEHLPWLHRESFSRIECLHEDADGWRARVGLAQGDSAGPADSAGAAPEILLELALERPALRYVARTLEGPGSGTEIWTRLIPLAPQRTRIEVEFLLPGIPRERRDALGRAYVRLYTLLWDQDESMMRQREAQLARRAPPATASLALGPLASLRARLPLRIELGGREFRLLELDGELVAHATQCPHRLGPLAEAQVEDGCLRCPWHGHRFDVRTGASADGRRLRLASAPRIVVAPDGAQVELRLGW
jgi:nitrite reductase/ring-hydroxylating ferredoxin subunit